MQKDIFPYCKEPYNIRVKWLLAVSVQVNTTWIKINKLKFQLLLNHVKVYILFRLMIV